METDLLKAVRGYLQESLDLTRSLLAAEDLIQGMARSIALVQDALSRGRTLLVAGNGGSAADAQHFAAEFTGRYKINRRAYPALALTTDTSFLTAWSNDADFATVFSRQIEALGHSGDVLIVLTTSGESENLIRAVVTCKEKRISTIGFLGKGGGRLKGLVDVSLVVPSGNTPRIQEVHTLFLHMICEEAEKHLANA